MIKNEMALLAMGCFWAPDKLFSKTYGVINTTVGYSGGDKPDPTYENLGDHTETIKVEYDPKKISFKELLDIFFNNHNPSIPESRQYRSVIFALNKNQEKIAINVLNKLKTKNPSILTVIEQAKKFYPAEEYHQKYLLKNKHKNIC